MQDPGDQNGHKGYPLQANPTETQQYPLAPSRKLYEAPCNTPLGLYIYCFWLQSLLRIHTYMYRYMFKSIYIYVNMHIYIYIDLYTHKDTCAYMYIHIGVGEGTP